MTLNINSLIKGLSAINIIGKISRSYVVSQKIREILRCGILQ